MAKINYIFDITYSKFDSFGNRYAIAIITQTETGRMAEFYAGYDVFPYTQVEKWLGVTKDNCYITERTVPIREFIRMKNRGIPELKEETLKFLFSLPIEN